MTGKRRIGIGDLLLSSCDGTLAGEEKVTFTKRGAVWIRGRNTML